MAITDPTLDPVTGIPLDASYATQYQVPLGSQPINLEELNAQGKQSNWLYPDNLPPVVARLQARDLTNPGNAQDLSTDGKRNLNVNIAASSGSSSGVSPIVDPQGSGFFHGTSPFALAIHQFTTFPFTIYGFSIGYVLETDTWNPPVQSSIQIYLAGDTTNKQIYLAAGFMKFEVAPNVTEMPEHRLDWPYNAPLQFSEVSFPGDTSVTLHFNCQNIDISFSAAFLYK